MLYWLATQYQDSWGPLRLFTSHFFLGGIGFALSCILTWRLLPLYSFKFCPRDRGRAHAVEAGKAQGKPTGTGIIFIPLFILVQLILLPWSVEFLGLLALTLLASIFGFLDDRASVAWGEYLKGAIDLAIGVVAAFFISKGLPVDVWLPFTKVTLTLSPWQYIPLATVWIWIAINATNCTDGVDGLSGTLSGIAFLCIGSLLYFVLGHVEMSAYLLVPHYKDGAIFGIMALCLSGTLAGYLWHNAHPSTLLMGDAGSRALGFLLGILVLKSGNPFLTFVVGGVLLINGGTGLVKVALLRFAKISIFRNIRFPLHDHVRKNLGPKPGEFPNWSTPQVLVRFALIQLVITMSLTVLLLKLR
ncbi:MAG: phospho-N-acetylmuramoyl-pentapeptide-transferase [Proteobacteria bacterium]|nr:phospho-N-acetylmuramoyl-pentapeptide-transferase [Pseudomonadota bacterium]